MFLAAVEAGDSDRADRAIVALIPHHVPDSLFEILRPLAWSSYVNIGHKIIYGTQIERTLRRIGWAHAEPALRSFVHALLHPGNDPLLPMHARSRELSSRLPEGWMNGREVPAESMTLMRTLRTASPAQAQDLMVEALKSGLGPATLWDALRLAASEIFFHRPTAPPEQSRSLLPVHAVTVTDAFGYAYRVTRLDSTRRLMLLQAASWRAGRDHSSACHRDVRESRVQYRPKTWSHRGKQCVATGTFSHSPPSSPCSAVLPGPGPTPQPAGRG